MTDKISEVEMNAMRVLLKKIHDKGHSLHPVGSSKFKLGRCPSVHIETVINEFVRPDDLLPKPVDGPDGEKARVHMVANSPNEKWNVHSGDWSLHGDLGESKADLIRRWNVVMGKINAN